jgi:beta-barrel assembly-enhancing protease
MTFNAIYFDGKSREGYPAKVTLSGSLHISYSDSVASHTVEWQPQKIQSNDFNENSKVYLKYGSAPMQYLEVSDMALIRELKANFPDAGFHKAGRGFLLSSGLIGLLILALALIGLLALTYFVFLPMAAESIAVRVPLEWEKQLGDASYSSMVDVKKIDAEDTKRINEFFGRLQYQSNYHIEITVVNEAVVNAFALPGGRIVVYKGIIGKMNSYKELAALLSHEFSHVELKHATRNMFRSLSGNMLLGLLIGDARGIMTLVIQNADQLKQLGYSRSLEEEADMNGLQLLKQRKIDPKGMLGLFSALKEEEGAAGKVPEFLSTHPLTERRIDRVGKEIAKQDFLINEDDALDSLFRELKNNGW